MRIGRFVATNGDTLNLDDIDDMPLPLQVKLLRVQEENQLERVLLTAFTNRMAFRLILFTPENCFMPYLTRLKMVFSKQVTR
jgi:DNA-binding NtrC family response regulator